MKQGRLISKWLCPVLIVANSIGSVRAGDETEFLEAIRPIVNSSPSLRSAKSELARAHAYADRLLAGPYETELTIAAGNHRVDNLLDGRDSFDEYSGGLSRTIRLPGKRNLDKKLANVEIAIAEKKYEKAWIDEQFEFLRQFSECKKGAAISNLSEQYSKDSEQLATLEQSKVEAGSGRQFSSDRLLHEARIASLHASQSKLQATQNCMNLESQFPVFTSHPILDLPSLNPESYKELISHELAEAPAITLAKLESKKASLLALRAKKEQLPDPTIGVEFTDEFDGQESTVLFSLKVPIGRLGRKAKVIETQETSVISDIEAQRLERQSKSQYSLIKQSAQLSMQLRSSIESAKSLSEKHMAQLQNGYELGLVTIDELLLARQSYQKNGILLIEQEIDAINSVLKLMILNQP